MNLQHVTALRAQVRSILESHYPGIDVYTAELTSIVGDDDVNVDEFMTVFLGDGEETQEDQNLDDETYRSVTQLTIGYFNDSAKLNQSILDDQAGVVRNIIMSLDFDGDITRAGWNYVAPVEGATAGIYFRFDVSFSN